MTRLGTGRKSPSGWIPGTGRFPTPSKAAPRPLLKTIQPGIQLGNISHLVRGKALILPLMTSTAEQRMCGNLPPLPHTASCLGGSLIYLYSFLPSSCIKYVYFPVNAGFSLLTRTEDITICPSFVGLKHSDGQM
jgi:hypothetical protein